MYVCRFIKTVKIYSLKNYCKENTVHQYKSTSPMNARTLHIHLIWYVTVLYLAQFYSTKVLHKHSEILNGGYTMSVSSVFKNKATLKQN